MTTTVDTSLHATKIEPKIVWAEILKNLARTMPSSTFSTWVKPLSVTQIETVADTRAIITLTAVSPYVAQQAEMRCYAQIKQAADAATGKLCDLVFATQSPGVPGRNFVEVATDEDFTEPSAPNNGYQQDSGYRPDHSYQQDNNYGSNTAYHQQSREPNKQSQHHLPLLSSSSPTSSGDTVTASSATLNPSSLKSSPATLFSPQQISMPVVDRYKLAAQKAHLREDFTFDTFAVSGSNEMAYAAAQAVAKSPGSVYNPLFLWGGVGVGKTHLMQSIGNVMLRANPDTPLLYTMGEEFLNEIIGAIRTKRTLDFKEKFRQLKVLLIDDIQFIAGKDTAQEEFFHTFNAITRAGGQIIMTSDRPPHEIHPLEDRLRSRFEGGLTIDIQQPTFELRTAILLIKAQKIGLELPMELAQMAAAEVESTRKLEGVIFKLHSAHRFQRRTLDEQLVREVLGGESKPVISKKKLKPSAILRAVTSHFHVSANTLRSGSRKKEYVTARHIAMFLMKSELNMPYAEIGATFGGRDHTSVMHAVQKIEQCLSENIPPSQDVSAIRVSLSTL